MTRDELLARIDKIEEDACWYQQKGSDCADMHSAINALRTAVELKIIVESATQSSPAQLSKP